MPDPPKFTFGGPAASSGTSSPSLFGSAPSGNTTSNLFGQSTGNTPASSGASLFGNTSTSGAGSGSGSGFSFGGAPAGGGSSLFGGGNNTASSGSGFSFGNKTADKPTSPAPTSSAPAPSSLFGNMANNSNAPSQNASGSTTPAANKPAPLSFSTTPAGPPPQGGTSMFGSKPASSAPSLFGQQQTNTVTSPFGETPGTVFGKPSENQPPASSLSTAPSLFGNAQAATQPSPNLFGNAGKSTITPDTGKEVQKPSGFSFPPTQNKPLFGAIDNPKPAESAPANMTSFSLGAPTPTLSKPPAMGGAATSSATTPSLFGKPGTTTPASATTSTGPSLFSNMSQKPNDNAQPAAAASTGGAPPSLFGGLGLNKPAGSSAPTSAISPAPSMFSMGKLDAAASSSAAPASTTATTSASTAPSLFGAKPAQPTSSAPSLSLPTPAAAAPANNTAGATSGTTPTLGASTSGPAPPAASRLATKSLDEILTLWSTSLASHQKTFGNLAIKVSGWDRMLVENSDKISKLYARTFQAERDTAEVERQLTLVEHEQQELERYLEEYEKKVDDAMIGKGGAEGGVDAERERTYGTAERCSTRLTDMSHDLTSMIEEINLASTNLRQSNKSANTQDPLSQIVRVLNGHLAQLQSIDSGASALQQKVAMAQKDVRSVGRNGGLGSDEADAFARSYLGRR